MGFRVKGLGVSVCGVPKKGFRAPGFQAFESLFRQDFVCTLGRGRRGWMRVSTGNSNESSPQVPERRCRILFWYRMKGLETRILGSGILYVEFEYSSNDGNALIRAGASENLFFCHHPRV